ncbi:MAG: M1 family peptidase [Proteobacteria bacterium]|nr:M1 family peptidase [Pseudomonadota bacterium]
MRLIIIAIVLWPGLAIAEPGTAPIHHQLRVTLEPGTGAITVVDRLRVEGGGVAVLKPPPGASINQIAIGGGITFGSRDGRWEIGFHGSMMHEATIGYRAILAPPKGPEGPGGPAQAVVGPEGSYLPGGAGWYPDFGDRPFTYDLTIDVPEEQRAVAPGRLASEEVADGRYRARFVFDRPAEDIALMAGPYEVTERFHGETRLRTYFHPEIADLADAYLKKSAEYLELYEGSIGDYPFSAFHVVSSPLPVGLGFPGLTYMGTRVLRLPFIRDTSLGHEVLHNWWGNGVTIDYATGNWAEGLTTFMADHAFAERRGEAREMRLRWLRDFAALPAMRDRPVRDFRGRSHGASQVTGYHKPAMLFVMLRDEIGAGAFDTAIRAFWQNHRFRRASWDDLRGAFEEASGRDLGGFFAQWLRRTGAPSIGLRSVTAEPAGDGYRVSFTLIQDSPAYALSVPVTIETESGDREHRVALPDRIERFTLTVDAKPRALEIDADARLFRRLAPDEVPVILRHAMLARDTALVIAADAPATAAAARALAERLVEGRIATTNLLPGPPGAPVLVIGATPEVAALLDAAGLGAAPAAVAGRGDARVWTARLATGQPMVVVEADDGAALERLARPLPHYGAKSYLVFEGGKVTMSGVWPPAARPLRVEFD